MSHVRPVVVERPREPVAQRNRRLPAERSRDERRVGVEAADVDRLLVRRPLDASNTSRAGDLDQQRGELPVADRAIAPHIEHFAIAAIARTRAKERVGRIVRLQADKREEVEKVFAGEIAAAVGLKDTKTSHTLCDEAKPIILEQIKFPEPVVSLRIEPKTKADQEKMGLALRKLADEGTIQLGGKGEEYV